jgi:integrase
MAKALTDMAVEKLRPGKARREIPDAKAAGLYLIIQPSGSKSWALRFRRPDGRPAKLTLGPVDFSDRKIHGAPKVGESLTLVAARQLVGNLNAERARGADLVADHRADKHRREVESAEASERLFPLLSHRFIENHKTKKHKTKPRRWRETAALLGWHFPKDKHGEPQIIRGSVADRWAERDVRGISEDELWSVIKEARDIGVPGRARRNADPSTARARHMFAALSSFFAFLKRERLIAANPVAGLDRPSGPVARKRTLTMEELRWFWSACDAADAAWPSNSRKVFAPLFRLLLLSGCRLQEVARMTRGELGMDNWTIAAERVKNHRPHLVPLSALAAEQIAAAAGGEGEPGYMFTTNDGRSAVSGFSKSKRRVHEAMTQLAREETSDSEFNIARWTLHDLRRTFSTQLHALGVAPHVVEAALNHVSGHKSGVAGVYNLYEYLDEKRDALERWARWIALVTDRDLYAKHRRFVRDDYAEKRKDDDEARKKARKIFLDAIVTGGERWERYLDTLVSDSSEKVINPQQAANHDQRAREGTQV